MRKLFVMGLLGGAALVLGPAIARTPQPAVKDQGLCRRAVPLPPLPPETRPPLQGQDRWSPREAAVSTPTPEPVPAPEPMMMAEAPPTDSSPIAVTGSRIAPEASAKRSSSTVVDSITAEDVGALPDRSVTESLARIPGVAVSREVSEPMPEPMATTVPTGSRGRVQQQTRAGLLTAGDHDDLLNPELYARYVTNFLKTETLKGVPRVDTARVLTVAVKDNAGRAVPFARVTLTCADGNSLTLATLADGTAVFFPGLDRLGSSVKLSVGDARRTVSISGAPGQQLQTVTIGGGAGAVRRFDLAVVIDTTGSMGDELEYLKAELRSILDDVKAKHQGLDVRLALIAYRDKGDEYVTRSFPFTGDLGAVQANLSAQRADGGGDYPEAVEQALARAMAFDWRPDAVKSMLWVADAPPHGEDVAPSWAAAEVARAKRIQVVPVAASGVGEGAEYLMRAVAAATQSRYLFLTDDSGIGNPHAPPAVDCYLVTRLNALVRRVLDSQISGRRVEPGQGEVIRSVGNYDRGKCVLPPDFGRQE
jgi:hypothetical protein